MARFLHQKNPCFLRDLSRSSYTHAERSSSRLGHETLEQFYSRILWQYLVSLTFKDCSIMMTMQRIADPDPSDADSEEQELPSSQGNLLFDEEIGAEFSVSMAVIDMDPKFPDSFDQLERRLLTKDCRSTGNLVTISDQNGNTEFIPRCCIDA